MSQRDRTIITVVVAAAILAGFYFLALAPKRSESASLQTKITAADGRLATAQSQLSAAEAAKHQYATNYAAVTRLGKAVPADDDVPSLIVQVSSTAKRSSVNFRALKVSSSGSGAAPANAPANASTAAALPPGATVGAAGLPVMPFSFTFDGSFFKLSDFMSRMERFIYQQNKVLNVSGRLLTIDSLKLGAGPSGFPRMTAEVGATAYLAPENEGVTGGATPTTPPASGTTPPATQASSGSATPSATVKAP
jgi:Pilus assembly protein, PilO